MQKYVNGANAVKKKPLLSVIIPTYKRPQYLPRAINSAVQAAPDGDVEVIVVPNGPDDSWKNVAKKYQSEPRVQWHSIATEHANVARNYGKQLARGKYIRFLDDDDYLLPAATKQLGIAVNTKAEITSGSVDLVTDDNLQLKTLAIHSREDFVNGILAPGRKTGLQFHLYQRSAISPFNFDETISIGQDTHWTHALCRKKDWKWSTVSDSVCTWVQHAGSQISSKLGVSGHLKLQERMLWETIIALQETGRLTKSREEDASYGMWGLIHSGFFLAPVHWGGVIRKTQLFFPNTFPDIPIYKTPYGKPIDPLVLESLMLPKRWINHAYRQWLVMAGLKSQWQFSL